MYGEDTSKYEQDCGRNLLIRRIFDMIPSQMENKKKRIVAKDIRDKEGIVLADTQKSLSISSRRASRLMSMPFLTPSIR